MKRFTLFALLLLMGLSQHSFARDGYHIKLKFTDMKDSLVYLAHYYGKPLPTIYKADSAKLNSKGEAILDSKEKTLGGIYIILLNDKKTYFEFLLDNGNEMTITATASKLPEGLKFEGSPENTHFQEYVTFLKDFGTRQQKLVDGYKAAKTKADSTEYREKIGKGSKELIKFRQNYAAKYPGTLLSAIFNALEVPEVPEGTHYLPDGKVDSNFSYNYYKTHYWDHFNFQDDRLVQTPIYDGKLDEYFNKVVLPWPDSVEHEADVLLAKARGTKDVFKYTLWWLTHNVENSKIMGMDAVFVYLVENYYMKGDATWLDNDALSKYYDRASKIAPNVIGNVAPDVNLPDAKGTVQSMYNVKGKYTLLVFWSPDCGHCQHEMPVLDSLYKAVLKNKGVKVYAVNVDNEDTKWSDFIKKNKLEEWTNVWDKDHNSDFRSKYDVYSTPTIYLLDEKKIIRGKRLDHSNIMSVIEILEKKDKTTKR
ncbi:MAG: redoxin domain-containing protein [Bacteroidetes bacterium]|nr:redoxin domain-containing protein [Bacteroidota bacterium]